MTLKHQRIKDTQQTYHNHPPTAKFHFHHALRPAVFELKATLKQVHQMTPKMTINSKILMVPYKRSYSQILTSVVLRPDVFKLQTILRQVYWTTPKSPWTLKAWKGQRYPIKYHNYPRVPGFTLWPVVLELHAILRQVHRMIPNSNIKNLKVSKYLPQLPLKPQTSLPLCSMEVCVFVCGGGGGFNYVTDHFEASVIGIFFSTFPLAAIINFNLSF